MARPTGSSERLRIAIDALIQATTWRDRRQLVRAYPELLSKAADQLLQQLITYVHGRPDVDWQDQAKACLALLGRCRAVGVPRAFAERGDITILPDLLQALHPQGSAPRESLCVAFLANDGLGSFRANLEESRPLLDDMFFAECSAICKEIEQNGFAELAENLRLRKDVVAGILAQLYLQDLYEAVASAPSTRAALEVVIAAAKSAPDWLSSGLDVFARWVESEGLDEAERVWRMTLPNMLKMARDSLAAGWTWGAVVKYLEAPDTLPMVQTARLEEAEQAVERAEQSGYGPVLSEALDQAAQILQEVGARDEATEYYQKAIQAAIDNRSTTSELRARAHLGQLYVEVGQPELAQRELELALRLLESDPDLLTEASILKSMGHIYLHKGALSRALDAFEQALKIGEALGNREQQAIILSFLGQVHLLLNRRKEAVQCLRRITKLAAQLDYPSSVLAVSGSLAMNITRHENWEQNRGTSFELRPFLPQMDTLHFGLVALLESGNALYLWGFEHGDRKSLEKAAHEYTGSLELARQLGLPVREISVLVDLAGAQIALGNYEVATKILGDAARVAADVRYIYGEYYARYSLAVLYDLALDDPQRAAPEYMRAIQLLEEQRSDLSANEGYEWQFFEEKADVYRLAAEAYFKLDQPLLALGILENGRARILAKRLSLRDTSQPGVPDELWMRYTGDLAWAQYLRSRVYTEPDWRARVFQDRDDDGLKQETLMQMLVEAEDKLAATIEEVRTHAPGFEGVGVQPVEPLDISQIIHDPEVAVMALFIGQAEGKVIVLHSSDIRTIDLPDLSRADVQRLLWNSPSEPQAEIHDGSSVKPAFWLVYSDYYRILSTMLREPETFEIGWASATVLLFSEQERFEDPERWYGQFSLEEQTVRDTIIADISTATGSTATVFDIDREQWLVLWKRLSEYVACELHDRLWKPLLPVLRSLGATRVVVIPDSGLHILPLHIGLANVPNAPHILIAPSLSIYDQCVRRSREHDRYDNTLMLIVNPNKDLVAADVEARLIREVFDKHHESTYILEGDQVTAENIRRMSRVGTYWHFAGHAVYLVEDPSLSSLMCANNESLPLFWIQMRMDFRATRLVVLSACTTALTEPTDPLAEYVGLFSGFLAAGVPTVLASLWPVNSVSTALLMARFYHNHLGEPEQSLPPMHPADALAEAQEWLRKLGKEELVDLIVSLPEDNPIWELILPVLELDRPFANPYFWAGFIVAGA